MTALDECKAYPRNRSRLGRVIVAIAVLTTSFAVRAQEQPIAAVLKSHEVDFLYRSTNARFPCYELQGRVSAILRTLGARDDIKVNVSDCSQALGMEDTSSSSFDRWNESFESPTDRFRNRRTEREQAARIRVRMMFPVAVTPEVLAEIDKDKSRRELISRVTGNPMAAMNDPIVFAAQRQSVTLSHRTVNLEPEDCELLEQMSTSVFRELDLRVVRGLNCNSMSHIAPQVTVEALLPVGMPQTPVIPPASQPGTVAEPPVEVAVEAGP